MMKELRQKTIETPFGVAVVMKREDFEKIIDEKFTPSLVVIEDEWIGYYNTFTCYSSYYFGGTCRCISHRPKVWEAFDFFTGKWL